MAHARHLTACLAVALFLAVPSVGEAVDITSRNETTPFPGVRVVEGRTANPATDFYVAYVSLCNDYIHVDASGYSSLRTAATWASGAGAELSVNGDFFATSGTLHVYGDAVGGGTRWPSIRTGRDPSYAGDWYYQDYGWIGFGDGMVEYSNTKRVKQRGLSLTGWSPDTVTTSIPPGTKALVSGFPQLVIDGAAVSCASPTDTACFPDRSDMRARHPRTAMGLTRDRKTFILLVVDGRSTRSAGMYGTEEADLIEQLGAWTAFNLDGGGSSQMWVRGQGTINAPSDGTPRGVLNHWGIFAGTDNGLSALPGSCDLDYDGLVHQWAGRVGPSRLDLDGDGRADVCVRTATGVQCALAADGGFGPVFEGPALTDSGGWGDPSNYGTMRFGDVTGDGLTDLCARANAGMRCWPSTGGGFGPAITGPPLSDADGFDRDALFTTLRLAEVTGDGLDDICVRAADRFRCYPATGDGFDAGIDGPPLADATGWSDPSNYGTLRMGDVDGDGLADVCARANAQVYCWLAVDRFVTRIDGPLWADADGWTAYRFWSTIQLADLDADGRADLCGRAPSGLVCHLSTGAGFGPAIAGPALTDASGWNDPSNFETLRFADVTGDGLLDACARANAGLRCWPFDGSAFAATAITGPLADANGWSKPEHYRTIQFADLDADGDADLCARASAGVVCWLAGPGGFDTPTLTGPSWSNAAGFDAPQYYGTLAWTGWGRPSPPDPEPDAEPVDAGVDVGVDVAPGDVQAGDASADSTAALGDAVPDPGSVADAPGVDLSSAKTEVGAQDGQHLSSSCACTARDDRGPGAGGGLALCLIAAWAAHRRRRA